MKFWRHTSSIIKNSLYQKSYQFTFKLAVSLNKFFKTKEQLELIKTTHNIIPPT